MIFFRIILRPRQESRKETKGKDDFRAQVRFCSNKYAVIRYNSCLDEKQLRVILAHEMGHVFQAYLDGDGKTGKPDETATEPLATFIGVLAIIDKNNFYCHGTKKYLHNNIQEILDKSNIAEKFNLQYKTLSSWFHSLTYIRNICAHHSRLWNKTLAI